MVTGRLEDPDPLEPAPEELVRVVTGCPAEPGPLEAPDDELVRVVTGAPEPEAPADAPPPLVLVATAPAEDVPEP